MARTAQAPRKQRTRQHVIADLSIHHVEGFILQEGHTAQRTAWDYGYDLVLYTYDEQGYVEPGVAYLQLKASEELKPSGTEHVFDVDVRDYNLWTLERMPVFLILYEAKRGKACWLWVQGFFQADADRGPKRGAKTVRVRVPVRQAVSRRAIRAMRQIKHEAMGHLKR